MIEQVGILRREADRGVPLESIAQVTRRETDRDFGPGSDVPVLSGGPVEAHQAAVLVLAVDDVRVAGLG